MKRKPIVAANWKMNGTLDQAASLVSGLLPLLKNSAGHVQVVVCPPFTALARVSELLKGSAVELGAQNIHWEAQGAFTGEVSGLMLKDFGCRWAIVGHSERRQHFSESDAVIQKKVKAALAAGLNAILCVGETLQQRQADKTWEVIETQLKGGLDGMDAKTAAARLVIAYEPVWAIGTGLNATPAQAQQVHASIRNWLRTRFDGPTADSIRIQYGGSVKPDNAQELMSETDVDGALVGGASLDAKSFASIVESTAQAKEQGCSTH